MDYNEMVRELQKNEESLQNLMSKRENLKLELSEINEALDNLKSSDESYKIIGDIMVKMKRDELIDDINQRKESIEVKIKNIKKHEEILKNRSKEVQQELVRNMSKRN